MAEFVVTSGSRKKNEHTVYSVFMWLERTEIQVPRKRWQLDDALGSFIELKNIYKICVHKCIFVCTSSGGQAMVSLMVNARSRCASLRHAARGEDPRRTAALTRVATERAAQPNASPNSATRPHNLKVRQEHEDVTTCASHCVLRAEVGALTLQGLMFFGFCVTWKKQGSGEALQSKCR